MNESYKLDERGFVMKVGGKPFWFALFYGKPWSHYWHPNKMWVTLKEVSNEEIELAYLERLQPSYEKAYHDQHNLTLNTMGMEGDAPKINLN